MLGLLYARAKLLQAVVKYRGVGSGVLPTLVGDDQTPSETAVEQILP
jgi:hypothetical protein